MLRYTTLENVALPLIYAGYKKQDRLAMAKEVLEKVGLGDRLTHKPNEQSGGERQRVAIAQSSINNPSIILADEPTGNLDSKTSIEIMKLFDKIHALGNTVITGTYEEDIAEYAHRLIRLKNGKVLEDCANIEKSKTL